MSEDLAEEVINRCRQLLLRDRRRKRVLKYQCEAMMTEDTLAKFRQGWRERNVSTLLEIFNTYFASELRDMANLTLKQWSENQWILTTWNYKIILASLKDVYGRTHIIELFFYADDRLRMIYRGPQRWEESRNVHLEYTVRDVADPADMLKHPAQVDEIYNKFNWLKLEKRNKDMTDKILGLATQRLDAGAINYRYLPVELLHPGTDPNPVPAMAETIQTLVIERPRHNILYDSDSKLTVTFSDLLNRDWWGFDRYTEQGWPPDRDEICAYMNLEQTVTDVIKIRLVRTFYKYHKRYFWNVEVVRQVEGGEEIVKIGQDRTREIDYKINDAEQEEFARTLADKLHLRPALVDGVEEFSV